MPWLIVGAIAVTLAAALYWRLSTVSPVTSVSRGESLFDLAVETLDGRTESLSAFRGRVVLVVNVASECGLAFQYPGLESLYTRYRDRGFVVLAFPSNDFWQEPNDNDGIAQVCGLRGLTFPVFGRSHVRGRERSAVYDFLARTGETPLWNFAKYLVGRDGRPRAFFGSLVPPDSRELADAIERALAESVTLEAGRDQPPR